MSGDSPGPVPALIHATTVALNGRGLMIMGPSGAGKSVLALRMMALGAALVADDQTLLVPVEGQLIARCPPALSGMIEARGIGLLRADPAGPVALAHVVDLAQTETERLPPLRQVSICGTAIDLVLGQQADHFPSMLIQLLRTGRAEGMIGATG